MSSDWVQCPYRQPVPVPPCLHGVDPLYYLLPMGLQAVPAPRHGPLCFGIVSAPFPVCSAILQSWGSNGSHLLAGVVEVRILVPILLSLAVALGPDQVRVLPRNCHSQLGLDFRCRFLGVQTRVFFEAPPLLEGGSNVLYWFRSLNSPRWGASLDGQASWGSGDEFSNTPEKGTDCARTALVGTHRRKPWEHVAQNVLTPILIKPWKSRTCPADTDGHSSGNLAQISDTAILYLQNKTL